MIYLCSFAFFGLWYRGRFPNTNSAVHDGNAESVRSRFRRNRTTTFLFIHDILRSPLGASLCWLHRTNVSIVPSSFMDIAFDF